MAKTGFDWDEANLRKLHLANAHRGIDKDEVESVFDDPSKKIADNKYTGEEKRYEIIGLSNKKRLLTVIFAIRNNKIRYVTAWQTSSKGKNKRENH